MILTNVEAAFVIWISSDTEPDLDDTIRYALRQLAWSKMSAEGRTVVRRMAACLATGELE